VKTIAMNLPDASRPFTAAMLLAVCCLLVALGANAQSNDVPRALSLDEARQLALANDEQLAQMAQAVLGAEASVTAAGADRLPQVDLSGTWTRNLKKPSFFLPPDLATGLGGASSVEMGGDWDLSAAATATLNLWTAGRLSAARGMAREALASTRWQQALVRDAVVFQAEQAYFAVLLASEDVAIAEGAMAQAEENLRITREALGQGKASRYEMLRAQVTATNREAPVVQARNNLVLARQQLLRVCGLGQQTQLNLTDPLASVDKPQDLDPLIAEMNAHSPELRALEHSVKAAKLSVNLAKAGRGPVVQLQGQYALQGQWDDDILPTGDESVGSASVALGVSWPVFDGFAAKADIQGRQADLRQSQLELERVRRDRELGVRQAHTQLLNALLALEGRREGVDLAEETYRLAEIRLENGMATPLERLDAELALTEARAQLAQALYACNTAASSLTLAVGGANLPGDPAQET
jgi:outer membrane protein TolC